MTFQRFNVFWKHEGMYVLCIILRPTVTAVSVAIQAIPMSVRDKHIMSHHVPVFKLGGVGLFLLLSIFFSMWNISSDVSFQLFLYFWNHHHHTEKKKHNNNGLFKLICGALIFIFFSPSKHFFFLNIYSILFIDHSNDFLYYITRSSMYPLHLS